MDEVWQETAKKDEIAVHNSSRKEAWRLSHVGNTLRNFISEHRCARALCTDGLGMITTIGDAVDDCDNRLCAHIKSRQGRSDHGIQMVFLT